MLFSLFYIFLYSHLKPKGLSNVNKQAISSHLTLDNPKNVLDVAYRTIYTIEYATKNE